VLVTGLQPLQPARSSRLPAVAQETDGATLHQISRMQSEQSRAPDAENQKERVQAIAARDAAQSAHGQTETLKGNKMLLATAGAQQHRDLEAVFDPTIGRITTSPGRVGTISESTFRDQKQHPRQASKMGYPPRRKAQTQPPTVEW
jgi:hypothetical protein